MAQIRMLSSGRREKFFGRGEWVCGAIIVGLLAVALASSYIGDQIRTPQQVIPHEYTEFSGGIPPFH